MSNLWTQGHDIVIYKIHVSESNYVYNSIIHIIKLHTKKIKLIPHKISRTVLRKFMILGWVTFTAILGWIWPMGH